MISIVVPCYNEESIIQDFIVEIKKNIVLSSYNFEIIFIDNNSSDSTLHILERKIEDLTHSKVICLTNYFGKESAILAGLDVAKGDAVIIMDPDLEDPPELISDLIKFWKEGFDVVYAIRKSENISLSKKIIKKIFFFIFSIFLKKNNYIPENTGEFRILDRKEVDHIINMRERTRFLRGLVSFVGLNQKGIPFDRPFRKKGKSKSNLSFLIDYGMDAMISSTSMPASLITRFGIFLLVIIILIFIFVLANKFLSNPYQGFSFTILLILLLFSMNTIMIGILGEYVVRIYNEVKKRPNYIVRKIIDNNRL